MREQVIAANLDVVFIAASLGDELDARLLQRYVTLALESGARPALAHEGRSRADPSVVPKELAGIDDVIPIHAASTSVRARSRCARAPRTEPHGRTRRSLGVGKSTLVNALAGQDDLLPPARRAGRPGRHTTTRRQLVILPGGGLIVDNPGMRELHLWLAQDGLTDAFEDITALAAECRSPTAATSPSPVCRSSRVGRWSPDARALGALPLSSDELAELDDRLAQCERPRPASKAGRGSVVAPRATRRLPLQGSSSG